MKAVSDFENNPRLLMGPGPSSVHPDVLEALASPLIGHMDPKFITMVHETADDLKYLFRTTNALTLPLTGTGSAGMEACLLNIIEIGDTVVIGINGFFGLRISEIASRCGANIIHLYSLPGGIIRAAQVEVLLKLHNVKLVALVHVETSTGILQPLEEISTLVHEHGALLLVDAVASLGGVPVEVDRWNLDLVYSGTQKCLSCPPGLSPISLGERAIEVIKKRKSKVPSWYFDILLMENYWGRGLYHHTTPISLIFALNRSLKMLKEETLEKQLMRHKTLSDY